MIKDHALPFSVNEAELRLPDSKTEARTAQLGTASVDILKATPRLTNMHISRLFPARWARTVVERTNATGADMIVVTGDFIDGSVAMRRADVAPLAGLYQRLWALTL
ncbi:hypothetical protein AA18890_3094 [Komagataeibacter europaeus LMG 18890]|nr:hypothetical protein AA18890_3094 [Komagataeibacter europaeus LMG 18890]